MRLLALGTHERFFEVRDTSTDTSSETAPQVGSGGSAGSGGTDPPLKPVGGVQLFAGVILPFICLTISFPDRPVWQSGKVRDYAQLILSHAGSMPLYPFLLFSTISMALLFLYPEKFRENTFVRFGIFSGVLVAAEFWLVFQVAQFDSGPLEVFLSVISGFLPWGIWKFLGLFGEYRIWIVVGSLTLLAPFTVPAGIVVCLWCSTPWALASYLSTSLRLIRGGNARFSFSLAQLLGFVTWFAAHCSAWRLSYIVMLEEYSRLPTTPPQGCFVCAAVAKGHSCVVRGEDYRAPNGTTYRVNDQLRILKGFELLLVSISPKGHRACRWIYDRLGPRVAAMFVHPFAADVGYFVLKPVEWIAMICLRIAIPGKTELLYKLYQTESPRT